MSRKVVSGLILILSSVILAEVIFYYLILTGLLASSNTNQLVNNENQLKANNSMTDSQKDTFVFNEKALDNLRGIKKSGNAEAMLHYVYEGQVKDISRNGLTKDGVQYGLKLSIGPLNGSQGVHEFYFTDPKENSAELSNVKVLASKDGKLTEIRINEIEIQDILRFEMDIDLTKEWISAVSNYTITKL